MQYIELTVHTSTFGSELVSDILWNYTDLGVAISDVNDVLALAKLKRNTWDYIDEGLLNGNTDVLVKGFVPKDDAKTVAAIEADLIKLKNFCAFEVGGLEVVKREIDGDEWREKWKEHFKPIHIGKIVVVPEWLKYAPNSDETAVLLDSNMAFGTGEHETTSMCIELLQEYVGGGDTVIDVGCGSGILGITASKLGAKNVIMTDIDECAVTASAHNMQLNEVKNGEVLLKNLLDDEKTCGDVIVCNIMAEVLVSFADGIIKNVKKGGKIILSGILLSKIDFVKNAYEKAGFAFVKQLKKGEWAAMVFAVKE